MTDDYGKACAALRTEARRGMMRHARVTGVIAGDRLEAVVEILVGTVHAVPVSVLEAIVERRRRNGEHEPWR